MPRYVLHFGHNVYLTKDGGMTRKITEARVFYNKTEARTTAKHIVLPPHCARMARPPDPPAVEEFEGDAVTQELCFDVPPKICPIP